MKKVLWLTKRETEKRLWFESLTNVSAIISGGGAVVTRTTVILVCVAVCVVFGRMFTT